jgi:hypothetical protein
MPACFTPGSDGPPATITSTLSRADPAAMSALRSLFPSMERGSVRSPGHTHSRIARAAQERRDVLIPPARSHSRGLAPTTSAAGVCAYDDFDPVDPPRLRVSGERGERETESDREPDQPHGHLAGWLAGV